MANADAKLDERRRVVLGAAIAAIRARATARQRAGSAAPRLKAVPAMLGAQRFAPADGKHLVAEGASIVWFSLPHIALPSLCEAEESALEQCLACLHGDAGEWAVPVAQHIQNAVREVSRRGLEHSPELTSIALAAVHFLAEGEAQRCDPRTQVTLPLTYTERMACQAIVEACGSHNPTAHVLLDGLVEVAAALVASLVRELMLGRVPALDDAHARALLASAHIFEALESVTVMLTVQGRSLADLPSTRKLLALEQRVRDSDLNLRNHFPLVTSSITQCAWSAAFDDHAW
eukprot:CAMPEP_0179859752 /NCGR_PEP_ID=MMETSP0982-20121206/13195_1 /TAXON_ID=483367 /ORGANISM="non described non described, Strain CCMP 2436" /LENGTH=289 /DNA_ID=CAMNT_0021746847 /DNA_START=21 /DNA_END=891 /DNA_ORIENTATION=-